MFHMWNFITKKDEFNAFLITYLVLYNVKYCKFPSIKFENENKEFDIYT